MFQTLLLHFTFVIYVYTKRKIDLSEAYTKQLIAWVSQTPLLILVKIKQVRYECYYLKVNNFFIKLYVVVG